MSTVTDPWFRSTDAAWMCECLFPKHGSGSREMQPNELRQYLIGLAREQWRDLPGPARTTIRLAECIVDDEYLYLPRLRDVSDLADRMMSEFDGSAEAIADWTNALRTLGFESETTKPRTRIKATSWNQLLYLVAAPLWSFAPNARSIPSRYHRPHRLRDIYYHSTRCPQIDLEAIGESAIDLARTMAMTGSYHLMAILADELASRGCSDLEVLDHCRNPAHRHGPGCWVVEQCLAPIEAERKSWAENRFVDCLIGGDPACRS